MLVREAQLEPVDGQLELVKRDRARVVSVDKIEALIDRLVVLHQVVSNALEKATLPLLRVLDVLRVQLLLDTFERIVKLLVVKFVLVLVAHAEDSSDQGLFVLVQNNTVLEQQVEEDRL